MRYTQAYRVPYSPRFTAAEYHGLGREYEIRFPRSRNARNAIIVNEGIIRTTALKLCGCLVEYAGGRI